MRLDILGEHAGEAMFLFEHRQRALASLVLDRDFLRDLEERLVAHLDGLVVAGDAGWQVAVELAGADEPAGPFVTAAVASIGAVPAALDAMDAMLVSAQPAAAAAMLCALRLWPHAVAGGSDRALAWLDRPEARLRAAGLTALTAAGRQPAAAAAALSRALDDGAADPALLAAALARAGDSRDARYLPAVLTLAAHADAGVRRAALWAALLLDARRARDLARERLGDDADRAGAARALGIAGEARDALALGQALAGATPDAERAVLLALGNLGWAEAVDPLLDAAGGDGVRARVAGFALARILGVGGDWRSRPAQPPATGAGDDDGGGESWTPDQELPLWLVEPISAGWQAARARLAAGQRLRGGLALVAGASPRSRSPLGIQADEALEVALATPGAAPRDPSVLSLPALFAWRAPIAGAAAAPAAAERSRRA